MSTLPASEDRRTVAGATAVALEELIALRHAAPRLQPRPQARMPSPGVHASRSHGRGMDYAESRAYQPGDDARAIDWRVTARTGRAHTKLYREERERSLLLLVDTHPALRFGTRVRYKSVQLARAAALAAWTALRQGDRVGALACGALRDAEPVRSGARGVLAVLGALARWDAQPVLQPLPLSEGLVRARELVRGDMRVLLLSDGQSCDAGAEEALRRLRKRVEVRALIVADALELAPAPPGRYAFAHAGGRATLALEGGAARAAFAHQLGAGQQRLAAACAAAAVPWRRIDTAADPLSALRALLDARRGGTP